MLKKKYVFAGVGGYIAQKHLKAIKDTNGELLAAIDMHDSVGILDSYFPKCHFFLNENEFFSYIDDYQKNISPIDYAAVCTPNDLHFRYCKKFLERDINVVCEKPLCINSNEILMLKEQENSSKARVSTILQLRHHPSIIKIKNKISENPNKSYEVDLTYITSRGNWYKKSWKGDIVRSGGIAMNIGIHFFDMLYYIFGDVEEFQMHYRTEDTLSGFIKFLNADVKWFLSINESFLPSNFHEGDKKTYRSITINQDEIEFSSGFDDLHKVSYEQILQGHGFGLNDSKECIKIVENINALGLTEEKNNIHPLLLGSKKNE